MAAPPRFTVAQVVDSLNESKGMVYLAAKVLGCCPNTVYNYAERHPKVKEAIATQQGERLDAAELALLAAVEKGEAWAVCFTLKTLGKKRGFIERPGYYEKPREKPDGTTILDQINAMDATILPPGRMSSSKGNGKLVSKNGNGKA